MICRFQKKKKSDPSRRITNLYMPEFQQDGVTVYTARTARAVLEEIFQTRQYSQTVMFHDCTLSVTTGNYYLWNSYEQSLSI